MVRDMAQCVRQCGATGPFFNARSRWGKLHVSLHRFVSWHGGAGVGDCTAVSGPHGRDDAITRTAFCRNRQVMRLYASMKSSAVHHAIHFFAPPLGGVYVGVPLDGW